MSVVDIDRASLAERLMEEAEHSSEVAMRASLSRAYYAVYHLGVLVTGRTDHGTIRNLLRERNPAIGEFYAALLKRRTDSDYQPSFVAKEYGGLEQFRLAFREDMDRARDLFDWLKDQVVEHG